MPATNTNDSNADTRLAVNDNDTNDPEAAPLSAAIAPVPGEAIDMQRALDALLDCAPPVGWDDPEVIRARQEKLIDGAVAAADCMVELLVRFPDERRRGVALSEGGCVVAASMAMERLHFALRDYTRVYRWDGEAVMVAAIERGHGMAIADLVAASLLRLRGELDRAIAAAREAAGGW